MADLSSNLAGIRSPNPFWLASAPPTNSGYQVMRAFAAGWGGVVAMIGLMLAVGLGLTRWLAILPSRA